MVSQSQPIPILVSLPWRWKTVIRAACQFQKSINLCGKSSFIFYFLFWKKSCFILILWKIRNIAQAWTCISFNVLLRYVTISFSSECIMRNLENMSNCHMSKLHIVRGKFIVQGCKLILVYCTLVCEN